MTKKSNTQKRPVRPLLIIAVVAVLLFGSVAAAILLDTSASVKNTFIKAKVGSDVVEDTFEGEIKQNVCIKNVTGDEDNPASVPALIRAAIIVNWVDKDGNIVAKPAAADTYTIEYGDKWVKLSDGYYYYKGFVGAGKSTEALITSAEPSENATHKLVIEIAAEAIQANPPGAAQEAWGATFDGSTWTKVSTQTSGAGD